MNQARFVIALTLSVLMTASPSRAHDSEETLNEFLAEEPYVVSMSGCRSPHSFLTPLERYVLRDAFANTTTQFLTRMPDLDGGWLCPSPGLLRLCRNAEQRGSFPDATFEKDGIDALIRSTQVRQETLALGYTTVEMFTREILLNETRSVRQEVPPVCIDVPIFPHDDGADQR